MASLESLTSLRILRIVKIVKILGVTFLVAEPWTFRSRRSSIVNNGRSNSRNHLEVLNIIEHHPKKNTIEPAKIIDQYGADSVRLFILSDSPPEKDVQWSEQGMVSSYKFVQKLWILHLKIKNKISEEKKNTADNLELNKFTNQLIYKITNNLESFSYNVIIANMYETYNFLIKHIEKDINSKDLYDNYKKILTIFSPIIPHLASECLYDIGFKQNLNWPSVNLEYLKNVS